MECEPPAVSNHPLTLESEDNAQSVSMSLIRHKQHTHQNIKPRNTSTPSLTYALPPLGLLDSWMCQSHCMEGGETLLCLRLHKSTADSDPSNHLTGLIPVITCHLTQTSLCGNRDVLYPMFILKFHSKPLFIISC